MDNYHDMSIKYYRDLIDSGLSEKIASVIIEHEDRLINTVSYNILANKQDVMEIKKDIHNCSSIIPREIQSVKQTISSLRDAMQSNNMSFSAENCRLRLDTVNEISDIKVYISNISDKFNIEMYGVRLKNIIAITLSSIILAVVILEAIQHFIKV